MKNRANTLSAILSNMKDLEGAYESALDSDGSAERELDVYLESIQGRLDKFNNTLQTFWNNTLNSNLVKGIVDLGTNALKLVDTIGLIPTALAGVLFYFTAIKKNNPVILFKNLSADMYNYGQALNKVKDLQSYYTTAQRPTEKTKLEQWNTQRLAAYGQAVQDLTMKQKVAALTSAGLTEEEIRLAIGVKETTDAEFKAAVAEAQVAKAKQDNIKVSGALILANQKNLKLSLSQEAQNFLEEYSEQEITEALLDQENVKARLSEKDRQAILNAKQQTEANYKQNASLKGLGASLKAIINQNPMLFATAISGALAILTNHLENVTDKVEKLKDEYNELQSSISTLEGDINSLDSELSSLEEQIQALQGKDSLSIAEAEELNQLKLQTQELERQKELNESLLKLRESQNQTKTLSMINNMLETSAAGQEAAAEAGAKWGKILAGIATTIGWIAAFVEPTPAGEITMGSITSGALAAFTGGNMIVGSALISGASALGGAAGRIGGSHLKQSGDSLIEYYESYEKAIAEAQQKADQAHAKYMGNMTNRNYEKWQKKVEQVATLQSELSDALETYKGYIDNLEYNDQTAGLIEGYNQLITHIDIKNNEGNIDAQIASIEALKAEYYELSKGVDQNGKNVALSSKEYARYCSIIDQVLAYAPQVMQSYDDEGNAISKRNSLLADAIDLLHEQTRIEAKSQTTPKAMLESYASAQKAHDTAIKKMNATQMGTKSIGYTTGTSAYGNPLTVAAISVVDDYIASIIGVARDEKNETIEDYIVNNYNAVYDNLEEIVAQSQFSSTDANGTAWNSFDTKQQEAFRQWLLYVKAEVDIANKSFDAFYQKLYTIPPGSKYYNEMSGAQIAFINSYIDTLDNLNGKTDEEISGIRQKILDLSNLVGKSDFAKTNINQLFEFNPDEMSIDQYQDAICETLSSVAKYLNIPDDTKIAMYYQLFGADIASINTMVPEIAKKLTSGSEALVRNLKLPEIKIAYRYLLEEADGSMSFYELQQKIQEQTIEIDTPVVQTYSALTEQITSFNEIVEQTSEIIGDNTEVSQEYKDALIELGVTEEELEDCFGGTNKLVVKNAEELNKLIKTARNNTTQNVKLARSQALMKYHELSKQMAGYINAQDKVVDVKIDEVLALRDEMNALEKVISQYNRLELELLGAANAYKEFEKAQEADAQTDYISSAEDMAMALGEAFNTAELGTETAQAAITGLVPESVYKDLDTVEEKIAAIYDYFKNGKISQYFTLEYDENGAITSAEMKLGNLRKFIEDGLNLDANGDGIQVFEGEDWQHFEFSPEFLEGLENADDKLQYFADQMGVTKEVAFAFIESINDHDIEWLGGDYESLFDILVPKTLETRLDRSTRAIAEYNAEIVELQRQYENGEIDEDTYNNRRNEIKGQKDEAEEDLENAKRESRQNMFGETGVAVMDDNTADGYLEKNLEYKKSLEEVTKAEEDHKAAREAYNQAVADGADDSILNNLEQNYLDAGDAVALATKQMNAARDARDELTAPTTLELSIAQSDIQSDIEAAGDKFDKTIEENFGLDADGYWRLKTGISTSEIEAEMPGITEYVNLLNSNTLITSYLNGDEAATSAKALEETIDLVVDEIEANLIALNLDEKAVQNVVNEANKILKGLIHSWTLDISTNIKEKYPAIARILGMNSGDTEGEDGAAQVTGTARAIGTAHASGDWGLPKSEHNSLVGELGQEMVVDPHTGKYYTVGTSGAEMVDLPKDAIIFNHKQTEDLLEHGHINSRGKAYAEGNAHVTIWPDASSQEQWEGTGYSGPDDPTYGLDEAAEALSDVADEFREVFDWIEVRVEEISEKYDLKSAQLENGDIYLDKNRIIDDMISINEEMYDTLIAGAQKYNTFAEKLLAKVPEQYRAMAKNGAIAIEAFTGEVGEETLNAIQNYREWVQKAADSTKQAEETIAAIRDLVIQKIDTAYETGSLKADVEASQTEKLQNAVDLDEASGLITSGEYYAAMMENAERTIAYLTPSRDAMQATFDQAVKDGTLKVGSDAWYEELNKLYEIDAAMDEAIAQIEEYQNAINDLYWDNFDEQINRIDYIIDDTQGLIDLMDSAEMTEVLDKTKYEGGTVDFWTEDDVAWTKEGIATLGLYAQQMEAAEYKSKLYAEAIDDLNRDYKAGKYSENEYYEKLNELTSAQYDEIEAVNDAKEAIKDLTEARVDSIKEGIQAEIKAYSELIEKKKSELSAEKSLYDFQKQAAEQSKNIADLERKLMALSTDRSASATAQRKKLEAELAEARSAQEELYYERSIDEQQKALDKELEDFETTKEAEIEKWDEYLDNIEQIVTDSLTIVQGNADQIGQTLVDKTQEYNLTVSDAVLKPWKDGALAVDEYTTVFGDTVSSTTTQLDLIKGKWTAVWEELSKANTEAQKYNQIVNEAHNEHSVDQLHAENAQYVAATKQEPASTSGSGSTSNSQSSTSQKAITVGGRINAGSARIYGNSDGGGGGRQYFADDPIYTVLQEKNGYLLVRHHSASSGSSGWFKKSDVKAYAKGTLGVDKDQLALIDELGEELVMHADGSGRLAFLSKGSAVLPHTISENLMKLGELDPQEVLDRSRPQIGAPNITNNEINISMNIAEVVHVDTVTNDTLPDLTKVVKKQMDSYMANVNNALRRFTR